MYYLFVFYNIYIFFDDITWLFAYCKGGNLIFISGCVWTISSAKEGKSGFIYNLVKELMSFLSRTNVHAFHEIPNRIHTELTFINP